MTQKVSGEERLAAICQALRQETLTPAQQEAEALLLAATREAEHIREQAKKDAEELKLYAKREIEKERTLFHSSLQHAAFQALESLKGQIENLLFNKGLNALVNEQFQATESLGSILNALASMMEKEGLSEACDLWIGSHVNKEALLASLAKNALSIFSQDTIRIGSFPQGFRLLIKNKHMSIEVTEESVKELMASVLKRDFRKYLFQEAERS